jgi:ABC-type transporter Mla subunit MlaD
MKHSTQSTHKNNDPFHYRYRNFFVGLFLVTAIAIIPILLIYTLVKNDFLEHWVILTVQYENVYGMQKGAPVNFMGVEIGAVDEIVLNEDGYVEVYIKIRRRYFPLIEKGCIASLGQKNFVVGDWQINLAKTANADRPLHPGGRVPSQPPIPLDRVVEQLTAMVAVVDTLLMKVRSGDGLLGTLFNKDSLAGQVAAYAGKIDAVLAKVNRTITNADGMILSLNNFGTQGTATVDTFMQFSQDAGKLVDRLDTVALNLNEIALGLKRLPPDVDILIDGVKTDVKEAELLLKGLQRHWLFRRSVEKIRAETDTVSGR